MIRDSVARQNHVRDEASSDVRQRKVLSVALKRWLCSAFHSTGVTTGTGVHPRACSIRCGGGVRIAEAVVTADLTAVVLTPAAPALMVEDVG